MRWSNSFICIVFFKKCCVAFPTHVYCRPPEFARLITRIWIRINWTFHCLIIFLHVQYSEVQLLGHIIWTWTYLNTVNLPDKIIIIIKITIYFNLYKHDLKIKNDNLLKKKKNPWLYSALLESTQKPARARKKCREKHEPIGEWNCNWLKCLTNYRQTKETSKNKNTTYVHNYAVKKERKTPKNPPKHSVLEGNDKM